ncbi:hypothetical protein [Pacificoceanicola onchidii]|uniref:hypothetical protein n=1 Tax=Pacificoceanicola onchidii TaxID=2562685 RepID=UPI0010A67009|nr:hypothetical protein [Pacificoceanicola onchidii]
MTLDWPRSIPSFDPKFWDGYVATPPHNSNWHDHLKNGTQMVVRNAVQPFALYYENPCNLVLLSEELHESIGDWNGTIEGVKDGEISFGNQRRPYRFASLCFPNVLGASHFSPMNRFSRFEASEYHAHGTRVLRGMETTGQIPKALEEDLSFADRDAFNNAWQNLTKLVPQHMEFKAERPPKLFATGSDLFVIDQVVDALSKLPTPGITFPYPPISVTVDGSGGS